MHAVRGVGVEVRREPARRLPALTLLLLAQRHADAALRVLQCSTLEHAGPLLLHSIVELLLLLLLLLVVLLFHLRLSVAAAAAAAGAEVVRERTAGTHAHGSLPIDEILHR
jgi:hypothetical protein